MPGRPPLAMKLWLAERFGWIKPSDGSSGHAPGRAISIESLEHVVRNRVRTFLRHTWMVTILGTLILAVALWLGIYFTTKAEVLKVAAGPAGGVDAKFVHLLSDKLAAEHDRIHLEFIATAGPAESARAIADDKADLAILPSYIGASPDWPVVAGLRESVLALIVPAGAAVARTPAKKGKAAKAAKAAKKADKSDDSSSDDSDKLKVSQLAGRRVGIVTGSEASTDLLKLLLKYYGVPFDKVPVSQIDPGNLAAAIHDKKVDVLFVAGPTTGHAIAAAVAAATQDGQAPSFIAIDQAEGIAKRNPDFDSVDIDAGTFGGNPPVPDDGLKGLSFSNYLVARKSLNHDEIAALARLIFTTRQSLAAATDGEIRIKAPSTDKDATVMVHPGALSYLTDDQKSFFDKYGDDIFYGLLIFPVFGSAIAAVASYFRSSSRTHRLRLLQRLLDMVRKANVAPSPEALDQIQLDADNLVVAIIHQTEHEEFDETVRMSFSFALDQLRFAIAARRAKLLGHGGAEAKPGGKAVAA